MLSNPETWAIIAVVALILEMLVPAGIIIFAAPAAVITMAATVLIPGMSELMLLVIFSASAMLLTVFLRKRATGLLYPQKAGDVDGSSSAKARNVNSGADRYIGMRVRATTEFRDGRGRVKVGDTQWRAKGEDCEPDASLVVTGHEDGVTLLVKPVTPYEPERELA